MATELIATGAIVVSAVVATMLVLRKWIQDEGKRHEDMRQRHEDAQNDKISKLTTAVEKLCMQREDDRRVAEQRREDDRRVAEQRREDSLKREGATREEMAEIKSQLRNLCQQHITFRDLVTPHVLPARRPSDMDTDAAHAQDAPAAGHAPETTA